LEHNAAGGFLTRPFSFMKWLTFLFGIFIIAIIILADMGHLGFLRMLTNHNLDKVGHFILYGSMTLLLDLTFFRSHPHLSRKLILLRVGLIFALLIGLEEFSQRYFASRTFDLIDLTFSYLGVICFSWTAYKLQGWGYPPL